MLVLNEQELQKQSQNEFLIGIIKKVDNKESLTERDIDRLSDQSNYFASDKTEDNNQRWDCWREIVINIQNRYFIFGYVSGLTELQENDYSFTDFDEVIGTEKEKIIIELEWNLVNPKESKEPIEKFQQK